MQTMRLALLALLALPMAACATDDYVRVSINCVVEDPPSLQVGIEQSGTARFKDGEITHRVNFGDGTEADLDEKPFHTYAKPGTYTIKVTASQRDNVATDECEVEVPRGR